MNITTTPELTTSSTGTPVCAHDAHAEAASATAKRRPHYVRDLLGALGRGRAPESFHLRSAKFLLLSFLVLTPIARAQQPMQMPQQPAAQTEHHHGNIPPVEPHFPQMGRSQSAAASALVTLEQFQSLAREHNPTLKQAEAEIRAANARRQQAGLYPNPSVGYTGDEIRGGSVGGGKQGFFVEQTIVTGRKLQLAKDVLAHETQLATIEAEEQRIRVESAVKMAYIRVLAAQELLDTRRDLYNISQDRAETERRLFNTGQADETEVLDAEVDAQRMRTAARMQENTLREEWRSLGAVVGQPDMSMAVVAGDLEKDWPQLNEEETVEAIAKQSPAVRIAGSNAARAQASFARARRESIPDITVRGGMEYNDELLGSVPFAKGWEGIAELKVELPFFNRNQGNVAAASADIERANHEKTRIALTLRDRAASAVDQYANARLMASEFRDEMLPRARKSYGLMVEKYGLMLASYPRVLESQKKLFELQLEYIGALEGVWTNGIALQGFLLTDGLEAPATPGEVDRPIRETNVPTPERTMSPGESMPKP
jgi:cobalt-zinc-cadmium efflux system outer membrane protein